MGEVKLLEQFFSWQGEGPSSGKLAYFYRFAGCNLRCAFCDTKYAWQENSATESPKYDWVGRANLVVITGGEPLWEKNREMCKSLLSEIFIKDPFVRVEIETNGTCPPFNNDVVHFGTLKYIVSPKKEVHPSFFYRNDVVFKFVVGDSKDEEYFRWMYSILEQHKVRNTDIWIMPKGKNMKELFKSIKRCKLLAEEYEVNLCFRLQYLYQFK